MDITFPSNLTDGVPLAPPLPPLSPSSPPSPPLPPFPPGAVPFNQVGHHDNTLSFLGKQKDLSRPTWTECMSSHCCLSRHSSSRPQSSSPVTATSPSWLPMEPLSLMPIRWAGFLGKCLTNSASRSIYLAAVVPPNICFYLTDGCWLSSPAMPIDGTFQRTGF